MEPVQVFSWQTFWMKHLLSPAECVTIRLEMPVLMLLKEDLQLSVLQGLLLKMELLWRIWMIWTVEGTAVLAANSWGTWLQSSLTLVDLKVATELHTAKYLMDGSWMTIANKSFLHRHLIQVKVLKLSICYVTKTNVMYPFNFPPAIVLVIKINNWFEVIKCACCWIFSIDYV